MPDIKPKKSYIVCATVRTGSGVLCEALWNTGLLGKPDEYFVLENKKYYSELWSKKPDQDYFEEVIKYATTPNGVFGMKIMRKHFAHFMNKTINENDYMNIKSYHLLERKFPNLRFIWISRRDRVRQAISYWKNMNTGIHSWFGDKTANFKIDFDFMNIHQIVEEIEQWDNNWENFFKLNSIDPLNICYEDDIENGYSDVVKKICSFLSLPQPDDLLIKASRRKQSDEL